jgi:beta-1,4-mannosyl-glycoprotein beta-1,4-N-acetylglucosaminyltransferase
LQGISAPRKGVVAYFSLLYVVAKSSYLPNPFSLILISIIPIMPGRTPRAQWWYFAVATIICIFLLKQTGHNGSHSIASLTRKLHQYPFLQNESPDANDVDDFGFISNIEAAEEYCERYRWQPFLDRTKRRRIYDLTTVNTELDLLNLRMGEMSSEVDYFVVVESAMTFSNTAKTLYVREDWDSFAAYHDKIILHTINETGVPFPDAWSRESFARNAMFHQVFPMLDELQAPNPGDVILVSDVDEIVRPSVLRALRNCAFPKRLRLHTKIYYYSFQWLSQGRGHGEWDHPDATYFDGYADSPGKNGTTCTVDPQALRDGPADDEVWNAGWHCSFCLPRLADMVAKITSFSHTEMNRAEFREPAQIVRRVRMGLDIFARGGSNCHRVEENRDVPEVVARERERFGYLLDRDGVDAGFVDYEEVLGSVGGEK